MQNKKKVGDVFMILLEKPKVVQSTWLERVEVWSQLGDLDLIPSSLEQIYGTSFKKSPRQ
jgi:hypothetical protein